MSEHRKAMEQIAELAQTLGVKTSVYLRDGYDLLVEAGGEKGTSVYPDGTAIDAVELVIGGRYWEPQAVTFHTQKESRPATEAEIADRAAQAAQSGAAS